MPSSAAGYEVLTPSAAAELASQYLSGQSFTAREFGDGNLNLVFRVSTESGRSVIIKQALPYLRAAGDAWPLTLDRARIEAQALREIGALIPGFAPLVFAFDEARAAIVMEDLSPGSTWRSQLMAGSGTGSLPEDAAIFIARMILQTSASGAHDVDADAWSRRFPYTPLCLVTEQLVFSDPFVDAPSNFVLPEVEGQVATMQADPQVQAKVAAALQAFTSAKECLLHGDLHTGSIMDTPWGTRLIDFEFSFYGPLGFDSGMLLANLALARISSAVRGDFANATRIDSYAHRFTYRLRNELREVALTAGLQAHRELVSLLGDRTRQFMAIEMIRRVVSLARVQDIESLARGLAADATSRALSGGLAILLDDSSDDLQAIWNLATTEGRVP